jgi:prepilin-type N-terminal cleavage/methylation domain-containing protein/prepilin-type processing-associated H-X9-DG protein
MKSKPAAGGFTLVELLVVITIIGILVARLLPAVQAAREAARRLQCQNNFKQVGLAVLGYESRWQIFPPSSHWSPKTAANIESNNNPNLRESWLVMVLPYLEQQALYDKFDLSRPMTDAANRVARSTMLPVVLCPDDTYNRSPFNGSSSAMTNRLGDGWARCNCAANAALGFMTATAHGSASCALGAPGWGDTRFRGVMGANDSIRFAQMKDGSSCTVMLGEIRAGVTSFDSRGVWAMAGGCPNSLWAHGYYGDCWGPNNVSSSMCDDVMACTLIQAAVGGAQNLRYMGMSCSSDNWPNFQQTSRSMHLNGLHVCFCDGSVQWINDFIEVSTTMNHASVWDRLMLSADGVPIHASAY